MNALLLAVTSAAVVNPLRTRLGVPEDVKGRARLAPLLAGVAVAYGGIVGLGWFSGPLLDALEITPEYSLTAAGVVVIAGGLWVLFFPEPAPEPVPAGPGAWVWPVAFPRLFTPELAVLAIAIAARQGVADVAWSTALAVALVVALGPLRPTEPGRRALLWGGRVLSALVVFGGIWLIIEGIRAV